MSDVRKLVAESLQLELQVQRRVFELYGLTAEEIQVLRATAPPRDPLALAEEDARFLARCSEQRL